MLAKYQNIIVIVVIIAIAFGIYSYFFAGKTEAPLTAETVSAASPADQDLISLLLELKSITLDDSIFANPTFTSLHDFSQDLVAEPVGRPNPFAPLGAH
jgi:hypothetical protein